MLARLEKAWDYNLQQTAGAFAYLTTLEKLLNPDDGIRLRDVVGGANLRAAKRQLQNFKEDYEVGRQLSDGSAVLVSYTDTRQPAKTHIGVYPASKLPQLQLGLVWKYVGLAAGTVLTGAWFYFRSWDKELEAYGAETDNLLVKMALKMAETVGDVAAKDPAAAERLARANTEALLVAYQARTNPAKRKSWIDKLVGAAGGGVLLWVAGALLLAELGRRRR
jgi:hypothetical protein